MKIRSLFLFFLVLSLFSCSLGDIRDLDLIDITLEDKIIISDSIDDFPVNPNIPIPAGVTVSKGEYNNKIIIRWNQIYYGTAQMAYHVYKTTRETVIDPETSAENTVVSSSRLTTIPIESLYYEDSVERGLEYNKTYYYSVRAVDLTSAEDSGSGLSTEGYGFLLSPVSVISASFRSSEIEITIEWEKVTGANFYYLYKAEEENEGIEPNIDKFKLMEEAVSSLSYKDLSELHSGSVSSNKAYYYYVKACNSKKSISMASPIVRGALLIAGTPPAQKIVDVSDAEINGGIRVKWENAGKLKDFKLYRFSQENFDSGNFVGTEISLPEGSFINKQTDCLYYDISAEVANTSENFYYRIAGINEFGVGSLSEFDKFKPRDNLGYNFKEIAEPNVFVILNKPNGEMVYNVWWNPTANSEAYYLFRGFPIEDEDISTKPDSWWGDPCTTVYSHSFEEKLSDITTINPHFDFKTSRVAYRVLPINSTVISKYNLGDPFTVTYHPEKDYRQELAVAQNIEQNALTQKVGFTEFSNPVNYKLVMPNIVLTAATKGEIESGIKVTGKLSSNQGIGFVYKAELIRTCEYGDEEGVYPLSLPNVGTLDYTKKGIAPIVNTVAYDISNNINSDGTFEWDDPMPDFNAAGAVKEEGMLWNYARWDREAWKAILRQKQVDMRRFVTVTYQLKISEIENPETKKESTPFQGYPDLSAKEFAFLGKWQLDCALNTIWQFNVPRMLWDKTVNWLPNISVSFNGESSGKMTFNVGSVLNLTGNGGSSGTAYGDWPGYTIKANMAMAVSLETHQPRSVTLPSIEIVTPLYSGRMDIQMTVRDYGPFWGLWSEGDGSYTRGGYVKVSMTKPSKKSATFNPSEIIMIGTGGSDVFNYQVHGYNLDTDLAPAEKDSYAVKGTNSWHFTRINWPDRPYPANNASMLNKGKTGTVNYNLVNW